MDMITKKDYGKRFTNVVEDNPPQELGEVKQRETGFVNLKR
jgi:hypothetical protein